VAASLAALAEAGLMPAMDRDADLCPYVAAIEVDAPELRPLSGLPPADWRRLVVTCTSASVACKRPQG
jgi:hypothetical protein